MKVRALCATTLMAVAAAPAAASASNAISQRLHRADVALNKAQDAVDNGTDAKVVSSLRGVNRQTGLALKATLRLVAHDRRDADIALADTAEQLDTNAQAVSDVLADASPAVVDAIATTLAATDTGRGQILTTVQGLGDLEPDWGDALTQLADDAVNELTVAADDYAGLSPAAEDALSTFASHEADAAGAIVAEIVAINDGGDAMLDSDLLDTLGSDLADAGDAMGGVSGLRSANTATVAEIVTKLAALDPIVTTLTDDAYGYDDAGYWGDDASSDDTSYDTSSGAGSADAFAAWGWLPRGDGYRGWDDTGFGPGH